MIDECTLNMFSATRLVWYVYSSWGGGNVPAYSHELMEGVLHPYIFKGRCSHSERCACGDMEDNDRHMPQRYTRVQWSVQSPWKTKPSTL